MSITERATPWDPAARHRFVTSDGTALHVNDSGGPGLVTLVLAHGWTLDHTSWDRVVDALPSDVRVLRYDHRGHGGSAAAPQGTATIAQLADDLAELIADRVPDGPIVFAGHSMGGMTAMALAEQHPDVFARFRAIALVATSSGGLANPSLDLPKWLARRVAAGEKSINRRLASSRRSVLMRNPRIARYGLRWLLFGSAPRRSDVLAATMQVGRCNPAAMAGFRVSLNEHERLAALEAFGSVPVVIAAGGADRLTPVAHARRIAAAVPSARLVLYPGAGHMLPYERDADVAALIASLVSVVA